MQILIGNKIRELRHRDGRKQEDLADALGVTCQAVSRWEAAGGYPDLEIIPAIANYFHISIDELFGYNSDRDERIKSILERATKILTNQGFKMYTGSLPQEVEDCVNMLRAASEEFPNESKILLKFAQSLTMWGWNKYGAKGSVDDESGMFMEDTEYCSQNVFWQEAVRVYERILKSDPSADDRETAIYQLTVLYCRMGEHEKAKALANEQNSLIICKEKLLSAATVGAEKARYQSEEIMALLSWLDFAVSHAIASNFKLSASEYGKRVMLSLINVYEIIFIDGKCGKYHWNIAYLYLTLSHKASEGDDRKNALFYFDKGFEHCKEYKRICNEGNYKYTAPLVSNLESLNTGDLAPMEQGFWTKELKLYPQSILDEIRKNTKYAECFE